MRVIIIITIALCLLAARCEKGSEQGNCIQGEIVGQKCGAYALQLDTDTLGAREWQRRTEDGIKAYPNVIGLLGLPEEFQVEGKKVFLTLREPTKEESGFPCTFDWPGPPAPLYYVVTASEKCAD